MPFATSRPPRRHPALITRLETKYGLIESQIGLGIKNQVLLRGGALP